MSADVAIPGYEAFTQIGRGGFASVYRAHQPAYDRMVAVKVLDIGFEDDRSRKQFQRECAATGRLTGHPNIVIILEAGFTSAGKPYLSMDYCEHGSLADRLKTQGPFPVADVLRIGVKVAGALETAHQLGILHRDLKPENILVSGYGEPALADFGISSVTSKLEMSVTMAALTPNHAPPEILEGKKATAASDVYSLSSTLYTLLAGRPPFAMGESNSILAFITKVLREDVPPIPRIDVPEAVSTVLGYGMAKDPAARYATAAAFGEALQQLQAHLGLPVTEMTTRAGSFRATEQPPAAAPVAEVTYTAPVVPLVHQPDGPPVVGSSTLPGGTTDVHGTPVAPLTAALGASTTPGADLAAASAGGAGDLAAGAAPPAPPPAGTHTPGDGSATVFQGRHAPEVVRPEVPVTTEAGASSAKVFVGVLIAVVAVFGGGFLLWGKYGPGSGDTTGASTQKAPTESSVPSNQPSVTDGGSVGTSGASIPPTSDAGSSVTTTGGGAAAAAAPSGLDAQIVNGDALQVTWTDTNGGRFPYAFQVFTADGTKVSLSTPTTPGADSALVTASEIDGFDAGATYCVAVGTIAASGQPVWADASCTDGTEIPISQG